MQHNNCAGKAWAAFTQGLSLGVLGVLMLPMGRIFRTRLPSDDTPETTTLSDKKISNNELVPIAAVCSGALLTRIGKRTGVLLRKFAGPDPNDPTDLGLVGETKEQIQGAFSNGSRMACEAAVRCTLDERYGHSCAKHAFISGCCSGLMGTMVLDPLITRAFARIWKMPHRTALMPHASPEATTVALKARTVLLDAAFAALWSGVISIGSYWLFEAPCIVPALHLPRNQEKEEVEDKEGSKSK